MRAQNKHKRPINKECCFLFILFMVPLLVRYLRSANSVSECRVGTAHLPEFVGAGRVLPTIFLSLRKGDPQRPPLFCMSGGWAMPTLLYCFTLSPYLPISPSPYLRFYLLLSVCDLKVCRSGPDFIRHFERVCPRRIFLGHLKSNLPHRPTQHLTRLRHSTLL